MLVIYYYYYYFSSLVRVRACKSTVSSKTCYAHCKSTLDLTPTLVVFLSTIFQPMRSVDGRKEEPFD